MNGISSYEQNLIGTQNAISNNSEKESSQVVNAKAANSIALGGTSAGSIVTGEVTKVSGKNVQITLPNSQVVTARLEADIKLSTGQSVAFEVKSNSGSKIQLTPLFNNTAVNPAAIKALGQASILVNKMTLDMATAMMNEGMSIDRNSLQGMARLVSGYPEADVTNLVEMTARGIPINEDNVAQYAAYRNNEHQLINITEELATQIADVADTLSVDENIKLSEIFNGKIPEEIKKELSEGLQSKTIEPEPVVVQESPVMQKNGPLSILDIQASLQQEKADRAAEESLKIIQAEAEAEVLTEEEAPVEINKDSALMQVINEEDLTKTANLMKEIGMDESNLNILKSGDMEPGKLLSYLNQSIEMLKDGSIDGANLDPMDKARLKAMISEVGDSPVYRKLIKNSVVDDFSLKPDASMDKEKINQLYEKILRDSTRATELLKSLGKDNTEAAKGLDNIKSNISFMNQLNEVFSYVQIPMQLAGENAHGDLYVYTNKKKLAEKDGEITALLHLEMETLGNMDIHVTLKDSNNVKTHFVLENEEMLDYVAENIHLLDERLEKRGYHMTTDAALKSKDDDDKNPAISAMLGGAGKSSTANSVVRYSFDAKA